jgi:hypothetical protein
MDLKTLKFLYNYHPYIQYLPKREQKLIECFKAGMHQKETAQMLMVTQGAISSRMHRIKKRLVFIRRCKKFNIRENELDFFDPLNKAILKGLAETTCQSETAHRINEAFNLSGKDAMTQVKVRHRFGKCLKDLERCSKKNPIYKRYFNYFKFISKNLYMKHEIRLPQYD